MSRTSISEKTREQEMAMEESRQLFNTGQYHASLAGVFQYLDNGTGRNISFTSNGKNGDFQLLQGPVIVKGQITADSISAIAIIANMPAPSLPAMRRILESNLKLSYCRYSIHQTSLQLRFVHPVNTCLPDRLIAALKELALQAEETYWYLSKNFADLQMEPLAPFIPCSDQEKDVKFRYFSNWINEVLDFTGDPDAFGKTDNYSITMSISHLLLTAGYRIDFLLCPEGLLRNEVKDFLAIFSNDNLSFPDRHAEMIPLLESFASRSKEEITAAFYQPSFTFHNKETNCRYDLLNKEIHLMFEEAAEHKELEIDFVQNKIYELPLLLWQYKYQLPAPLSALLKVLMEVNYPEYFISIGFSKELFNPVSKKCNAKNIQDAVTAALQGIEKIFPASGFRADKLNFTSLSHFNHSFNNELTKLIASKPSGNKK